VVTGIASLTVALALLAWAVVDIVPDCTTSPGIKRLVSPETTCTSETGAGLLLALGALTLAAGALRVLSSERSVGATD
jgi:hypothetical protein